MGIILLDWARQSSPLTSPRHSSQITDNLKSRLWSWNMNCAYKGKWGLLRRTQIWGGVKGFSCGSDGKQAACNEGNAGSTPGSGRCPGEGNGYSLQYPCLENSMDREAGGTQSRLSQRLRHDWVTNTHTHILEFLGPKVRGPLPVRPGVVKSGNGSSAVTEPSALCLVRGQLTLDSARVCSLSPHAFQALTASPLWSVSHPSPPPIKDFSRVSFYLHWLSVSNYVS